MAGNNASNSLRGYPGMESVSAALEEYMFAVSSCIGSRWKITLPFGSMV
jgi:hypothetical protein|tara:strand:- start:249 stop:395 length:147 start_codon:yes stop_codon:yes gene_type:complete